MSSQVARKVLALSLSALALFLLAGSIPTEAQRAQPTEPIFSRRDDALIPPSPHDKLAIFGEDDNGLPPASRTGSISSKATRADFASTLLPLQQCSEWNLASDFQLSPNQVNPNPDFCSAPNVWYFMGSTSLDRNPQTYSLLPVFHNDLDGVPGFEVWMGTSTYPPSIAKNATGTTLTIGTVTILPDAINVHPAPSQLLVVGWRSPLTGNIVISGSASSADGHGGDGILWFIDKGATNLASGGYGNGGTQNFRDGTGGSSLANVMVAAGDFVYFTIHPKGDYGYDSTRLDIAISVAGLNYSGERVLNGTSSEVKYETDRRITFGDHIRLRLPFTNNGGTTISNPTIEVVGAPHSDVTPGVSVYNGSAWNSGATLNLEFVAPGKTEYLEFWIYVTDSDPDLRKSLGSQTWIEVSTLAWSWRANINLSLIDFSGVVTGNDDMEASFCLHNPDNPGIKQYAQYAAGACLKVDRTSKSEVCKPSPYPSNWGDPDTPAQAVRNLVDRVNAEFHYKDGRYHMRHPDTRLLTNRGGDIGVCVQYADLTTGLLRSLKLPARIVTAYLKYDKQLTGKSGSAGHMWSEAFIPDGQEPDWKQADSGWNKAIDQQSTYEDNVNFSEVTDAWADKYPLASASPWTNKKYRCVTPCYQTPVDCVECQWQSNSTEWSNSPSPSCVADVQPCYHDAGCSTALTSSTAIKLPATAGALLVNLESPTSVTLGVPFAISTGVTNNTVTPVNAVTTTVALREYADSAEDLFEVTPPYKVLNNVGAGETTTVTWTITPLVAGSGIPLRVSAESGDQSEVTEWPLVVNEPGTLPDLTLTGGCGLGNISPGQELTLTAGVLDENLQAFSDPATVITATVVATPTLQFSATLMLSDCASCNAYQGTITLPTTAPIGDYVVDFAASHPSHDPGHATSGFFVIPPLAVSLSTDQSVLGVLDTITLTAQVTDRGAAVRGATVSAEMITPGGMVMVPLYFDPDNGTYVSALRPADLAGNLGGEVRAGAWQVQASANYQGGTSSDDVSFTVVGAYPLSEVTIAKSETGATLTWPHMGGGVDHYEVYRSLSPYFNPGGAASEKLIPDVNLVAAAGDELSSIDSDAFAELGMSYFYVVQPVGANGEFYFKSNRVGVFNFALTPGISP